MGRRTGFSKFWGNGLVHGLARFAAVAALTVVAAETSTTPASATMTLMNEATLVPYDANIRSYPPTGGTATLMASDSQIVKDEPGVDILAIEQAPDILPPGPDGGYLNYSQQVAPQALHQINPLWITPETAVMGRAFAVQLNVPFDSVESIHVRQNDGHNGAQTLEARLERAPDGNTRAIVTPLLMGEVSIMLNADLSLHRFAVRNFTLPVAPPAEIPAQLWADESRHDMGMTAPMVLHVGTVRSLDPVAVLAAAPDNRLHITGQASFSALQDAASPVIALRPDGSFTGLREGRATIEVGFAGASASVQVLVDQRAPLLIDR